MRDSRFPLKHCFTIRKELQDNLIITNVALYITIFQQIVEGESECNEREAHIGSCQFVEGPTCLV